MEALGLPKTRLHDLRHAFARTYLAAGGDIHRLSEQTGHASYRITYDVYAEWIPSDGDEPNPLDRSKFSRPDGHTGLIRMTPV